jgi:hypothetical protein
MSNSSAAHSGTLRLTVDKTGFLLDRMGMDCTDLQFLRELTQNSIESILRTQSKCGEIIWDVDWITYDLEGTYKLSITDNGDGMTGEDMISYLNRLSSSGGVQAHHANFGVGAKIAAATRNQAGLVYLSWRDGSGSMIHLWKDPQNGEYGLQQLARPDGSYGHWARIEDDVKPEVIREHGTKVVLYGNSPDADTLTAPDGAPSPSRWVTRYLNTRYYRFPEGITVKAREGWQNDRNDKDRNVLRTIVGQERYLDDHLQASGNVELPNGIAHWWILRDESALTQNTGYIASSGHCAALWKNELYDMTPGGRANTAALQNFGVIFGYQQVVIYVEPREGPQVEILSNTPRTSLLMNGIPLPWADWQDEFRKQMPPEIAAHMEAVAAGSQSSDHSDSIRDRLKQIEELFKLSRYKPMKRGALLVSGDSPAAGGGVRDGERPASGRGGAGLNPGKNTSVYSLFLSENGVPGSESKPDLFPGVKWISAAEGTRNAGDLEDRAARYLVKDNLLLINADFRVFTDMIKRWTEHFANVPGAQKAVTDVVHEWFEQSLVETVLSSNTLRDAQHWTIENVDQLLCEEGLTAVVLPRWHIEQSIKRALGSKFGALKGKAA